jgi:hypothetical protein
MNQEEAQEMAAATERVISLKEYVEELKQLILDFDAFMDGHFSHTYNNDRNCILLRERMHELDITRDKGVQS